MWELLIRSNCGGGGGGEWGVELSNIADTA